MASLKTDLSLWKKVKTLNNDKEVGKELYIKFPLPITAKFLCIEVNSKISLP